MATKLVTYDIGDTAHFQIEFRNAAKALADPTTVTLVVRAPDGVETSYAVGGGVVIKDSVGMYHGDVSLTKSGRWAWKWVGTGSVAAVDEGAIFVDQTVF
jgi:hypothetical protein